ncbi:hypothetical protein Ahy_A10g046816 isoform A [Arachis hypogaea]|uniref:Uncharacterized protein n=1 Tax=Arachis hypogaea TaxID=3818 RepID=A0A445B0M2_ARAHY|nr:hypothetical protein Ahy_A10g046816 isoform A [Arachis hypogaea]
MPKKVEVERNERTRNLDRSSSNNFDFSLQQPQQKPYQQGATCFCFAMETPKFRREKVNLGLGLAPQKNESDYFQKKYQRWIKRNVAGIELLDLLLVWNTSDVITSLNLVGAPFQSLQYLPRKKKKFAVQARALSGFMPNPNPFAIGFSLHFKATNIILSKNG